MPHRPPERIRHPPFFQRLESPPRTQGLERVRPFARVRRVLAAHVSEEVRRPRRVRAKPLRRRLFHHDGARLEAAPGVPALEHDLHTHGAGHLQGVANHVPPPGLGTLIEAADGELLVIDQAPDTRRRPACASRCSWNSAS